MRRGKAKQKFLIDLDVDAFADAASEIMTERGMKLNHLVKASGVAHSNVYRLFRSSVKVDSLPIVMSIACALEMDVTPFLVGPAVRIRDRIDVSRLLRMPPRAA